MSLIRKVDELKQKRRGNGRALRVRQPVVLRGISPSKRVTVTPGMFGLLDVDLRYQRDRVNTEVGDLIEAIRRGGLIPDPVTLCTRPYEKDERASKKLWIIDGQQRTWAFLEMNVAFQADVHEAESLAAERDFFIIMQQHHKLGANQLVESWAGPSADMLRAVSSYRDHPMCGQVTFRGATRRFGAAIAIRAIGAAASGKYVPGNVAEALQVADASVSNGKLTKDRAAAVLRLLPDVFPQQYVKLLPACAVALVAHRRWQKAVVQPSKAVVSRLRRINWDADAPSASRRWMPILLAHIEKCWKER